MTHNIYEIKADISPYFVYRCNTHTVLCREVGTAQCVLYMCHSVINCLLCTSIGTAQKVLLKWHMTLKEEDLRSIKSTFALKRCSGTEQRRVKKLFDLSLGIFCERRTDAQLQWCI